MDIYDVKNRLFRVALKQSFRYFDCRSYLKPFSPAQLSPTLSALARHVRGVQRVASSDVVTAFFDEQATDSILSLPNIYWFWAVVQRAVIVHDLFPGEFPINQIHIKLAFKFLRSEIDRKLSLDRPIETLSERDYQRYCHEGVFILTEDNRHAGEDGDIFINPVFAPLPVRS